MPQASVLQDSMESEVSLPQIYTDQGTSVTQDKLEGLDTPNTFLPSNLESPIDLRGFSYPSVASPSLQLPSQYVSIGRLNRHKTNDSELFKSSSINRTSFKKFPHNTYLMIDLRKRLTGELVNDRGQISAVVSSQFMQRHAVFAYETKQIDAFREYVINTQSVEGDKPIRDIILEHSGLLVQGTDETRHSPDPKTPYASLKRLPRRTGRVNLSVDTRNKLNDSSMEMTHMQMDSEPPEQFLRKFRGERSWSLKNVAKLKKLGEPWETQYLPYGSKLIRNSLVLESVIMTRVNSHKMQLLHW